MQIQVTEGNGFFLLQQEGWDGMATVILTTKQYAKQAGEQPVGERVKITG